MDMSTAWLSELEMEDPSFMNYDQMSPLYDTGVDLFSTEIYSENKTIIDQRFQTEQPEIKLPTLEPLVATTLPSSNTFTISFGDLNPKHETLQLSDLHGYETVGTTKGPIRIQNSVQAQDHVLSERRRREKLNQHFISLSALLPKLKKMDKASVLEDASNYIKELQGRVKELEESPDNIRNDVQESGIYYLSNETTNSEERTTDPCNTFPEIEVWISGTSVLVRVECQKNITSLVNVLNQMRKLRLSIISSSVMPFAKTTFLINIVAQIEDDFCSTTTEIKKILQLAI